MFYYSITVLFTDMLAVLLTRVIINLRLFSQHPTVNDELPNRILSGTVQVKPNICRFQGSSVEFDDGSVVEDVDLVVGYLCIHTHPLTLTVCLFSCLPYTFIDSSIVGQCCVTEMSPPSCRCLPQVTGFPFRSWPHMWSLCPRTKHLCTSMCFLLRWIAQLWLSLV